jgi:hypothetical protein
MPSRINCSSCSVLFVSFLCFMFISSLWFVIGSSVVLASAVLLAEG